MRVRWLPWRNLRPEQGLSASVTNAFSRSGNTCPVAGHGHEAYDPRTDAPMTPDSAPRATSPGPLPPGGAPVDRLRSNLSALYDRIEAARRKGPSSAPRVTLVAVTKAAPSTGFDLLRAIGEKDVGENRVLDAVSKKAQAPPGLVWHGIGHLQTNKAKKAVRTFDVFHALDSLHLAKALAEDLEKAPRDYAWPVYLEVNVAKDPKKGGFLPDKALEAWEEVNGVPHLEVVGLMTMAKEEDVGEKARPAFRALRELRDAGVAKGLARPDACGLSMGMSNDFEVAVEEGATIVRIGRAVWDGVSPGATLDGPQAARTLSVERTS